MRLRSTRATAVVFGLLLSLSGGLLGATASTAAPVKAGMPASAYSDTFAKKTHDLMNAERAKVGARPLAWNQRIADVSQDWANRLGVATSDPGFDFAGIHRPDAGGSLIPSGATMYREIVGFNFTPEQIVAWWMSSPSHKAVMLDSRLTDDGIGYVVPASGPYQGWHLVVSNLAAYPTTVSPVAPAQAPLSPIGVKAASYGGGLGRAISAEVAGLKNRGSYQCFVVGCILYSPATGARLTMGGIRSAWAASGYENGFLGYPVTDEIGGLRNGGVYQSYQYGAIIWSPSTGGFVSRGGIRSLWASTGYENGRLGYPTSNEYSTGLGGAVAQNYQGGVIHWGPAGSWVTYK
jgi:hypothetical protein